jgi:hypothetical protein
MLPGDNDGGPGNTELYNKYFGPGRFEGRPWYGPHLEEKNDNNGCLFEAVKRASGRSNRKPAFYVRPPQRSPLGWGVFGMKDRKRRCSCAGP